MAKVKSILLRLNVDKAQRAHCCQHNKNHRLEAGDVRLKITNDRSHEHFCADCALEMIDAAILRLTQLKNQIQSMK